MNVAKMRLGLMQLAGPQTAVIFVTLHSLPPPL